MISIWILTFFSLRVGHADSSRGTLVVTPALMHQHLTQSSREFDFDYQFGRLLYEHRYTYLDVVGYAKFGNLPAAQTLSSVLNARYGVRLILAAKIDDLITPMYSGLVMGPTGEVVANFKLLSGFRQAEDIAAVIEVTAQRMDRYALDRRKFARLAFEEVRVAAGYDREDPVDSIELSTPELIERYYQILRHMRRAMALFPPDRPTWILAHMRTDDPFTAKELAMIQTLPGGTLARIIVLPPSHVLTFDGGPVRIEPRNCTNSLWESRGP